MRRMLVVILLLSLIITGAVSAQESDIFTDPWRAEYYNNPDLEGLPNLIRFDNGVGFDWGMNAPIAGLPADDFSVVWSKGGYLPSGTYSFILTASTGFRLHINDDILLDAWDGNNDGLTTGTSIELEAGFYEIVLEYYDDDGDAYVYLDWGIAPDDSLPQSTTASENTVTVMVNTLNVRDGARIANNIIARISLGQNFVELDRSEDGRWVQIDLGNGQIGWVSAAYVTTATSQED